nr:thioesterase family protein [Marivibrio halodurans]
MITGHSDRVRPEWIDYNGHMNVAYYVLAFDGATDYFADRIGLDAAYRTRHEASFFAVDMNVGYRREVIEGASLAFTTQLIDFDAKRLHFFHAMWQVEEGYLAATNEVLTTHVDMRARRSTPMGAEVLAAVKALWARQGDLPMPEGAGRVLGIRRKGAGNGA